MKNFWLFTVLLVFICPLCSCITTEIKKSPDLFLDIKNLPYAQSKSKLLAKVESLNLRNAALEDKKHALRLVQYGLNKFQKDDGFILPLLKASFFIADVSTGKESVAYTEEAIKNILPGKCISFEISYYYALNLGIILNERGLFELSKLPVIHEALLCACKKPEIDFAGPLRVIGYLYFKAPAWPQGIGDIDKALKYLKLSVEKGSEFPENYIFYAEALIENDEKDEAARILLKASSLLDQKKWGRHYIDRWKKQLLILQKKF